MATKEDIFTKVESKIPSSESLQDAAKAIQDAAEQMIRFSRQATAEAKTELEGGVKKATSLVKKYPLESALACFGAGLIAGMIFKNRD